MHIISLDLENVKSYSSAHIPFTEGTNAIVGHNGAGKSTILEAIGFALFDHLPYNQADFVQEGAKSATVTVTFASSLDERPYQAVRRCGSSSQYYIYDEALGAKVCEGKSDVSTFLHEHMGVDATTDIAKLFSDAVGVPQGTLTAAFLQTPANRKPIFDPLLRVEEYKKAFDALREPGSLLRSQQGELEVTISGLQARLERLPGLQESVQSLQESIANDAKALDDTQAQLVDVQAQRQALEETRQAINELTSATRQAEQQVDAYRRQTETARCALAEAEEARKVVAQNRPGHDAYEAARARQEELEAQRREREKLQQKQAGRDKALSLAQAELARQQKALDEIAQAEKQVAQLAPAVEEQIRLEGALSTARQQAARLSDAQADVVRHQEEVARQEAHLEQLGEKLDQVAELETALANAQAEAETWQKNLETEREKLVRCKTEVAQIQEQIAALENVDSAICPVCEQPLTAAHRTDLLERNNERLAALRAEWQRAQETVRANEQALRAAQKTSRELEQQLRHLPRAEEEKSARKELQQRREQLAEAEERVQELSNAPEQVESLQSALTELGNPRQERDVAAEKAARRAETEQALEKVRQEIDSHEQMLAELRQALDQFAQLDAALANVAAQLKEHEPAYQQVVQNQRMAQTVEARQAAVAEGEEALQAAQERLQQKQAELAAYAAQFDAERYTELTQQEQALQNRQGSLRGQLTEKRKRLAEEEAEIEQLARRQQELEAAQTKQRQLRDQEELLGYLRNVLKEAGPYVTKALVQQISHGAAQLFSEIMEDYSRHLRWDEDYAVSLEVDGRERQFVQLSGGEQMSAALAVRLALLREMSDIEVAFFDEPTTNLDETRRESLARQILDIRGFRQLFVISHDDTFEQATQNLIRVQKVNGTSAIE